MNYGPAPPNGALSYLTDHSNASTDTDAITGTRAGALAHPVDEIDQRHQNFTC
jgi:hypothetical protein